MCWWKSMLSLVHYYSCHFKIPRGSEAWIHYHWGRCFPCSAWKYCSVHGRHNCVYWPIRLAVFGSSWDKKERVERIKPNKHLCDADPAYAWVDIQCWPVLKNIYYFRDDVSTGMFSQVSMLTWRKLWARVTDSKWNRKFTAVVANKRHHTRAFRKHLIALVTQSWNSHWKGCNVALQGKLRHQPHQLQSMIYDHYYQYMRSMTSVSYVSWSTAPFQSFK